MSRCYLDIKKSKGLPLGNLASQLLVNVCMNEFDQWVKHVAKAKYYIRYADDFVILDSARLNLAEMLPQITAVLESRLKLSLHPNKVFIKTFASGTDFLGRVHFPDHRVLRTATKWRTLRCIRDCENGSGIHSYRGLLSYGNTNTIPS